MQNRDPAAGFHSNRYQGAHMGTASVTKRLRLVL